MFLVLAVAGLVAGLVVRANSTSQLTCNGLLETCLRNHPLPPATPNTLENRDLTKTNRSPNGQTLEPTEAGAP